LETNTQNFYKVFFGRLINPSSLHLIATFALSIPFTAKSIDLNEAYQLGLKNDPQYASALANFRAFQERIPQARAALRPILSWTIGANTSLSKSLSANTTNDISNIFRANQTDIYNTTTTNSTIEGNNNSINTSGTNKSDTTSILLNESSSFLNESRGWAEPQQSSLNRSLASFLAFSMPLYRPALNAQLDQSKLIVMQAEFQLQSAKIDMTLRVVQAYFDVVIAEENIITIAAQKKATVEQFTSAKQNFEIGVATITDTNEAQAKFDLVQALEIIAVNERRIKSSALKAIIGSLPSSVRRLKRGNMYLTKPIPETIDAWIDLAEKNSYSILAQKIAKEIAQKEIEKQNAAYKPTLDLNANVGINRTFTRNTNDSNGINNSISTNQTNNNSSSNSINSSTINSTSTTNIISETNSIVNTSIQTNTANYSSFLKSRTIEKTASIGLQFVMPLYEGGLFDSRVREAIAQLEKVSADLDWIRAITAMNVNKSYLGVMSSHALVSAYEVAVTSNEMAVNSNKLGYEIGMRLNIDVLNAQQQLFTARRDLARARIDALLNVFQLKAAVGKLNETDIQFANQWLTEAASKTE
jgi:outer membrane protein